MEKHTSSFGAWVGCIIGGVFLSATNYDLPGDYNYSSATLCILCACTMNRFITATSETKKGVWIVVSGVLLGLMMSLRQPLMAAACPVFLSGFLLCQEKGILY